MNSILSSLKEQNMKWKVNLLSPYFKEGEKILDFGCGDLSFANELKKRNKDLKITGVDVVEFPERIKNIRFIKYDGNTLPFKDKSFDTVISFYVFHHCPSVEKALMECMRVAKKRVIFVEAVARHVNEKYPMMFIDFLCNLWKRELIPFTSQFYTRTQWSKILGKYKTSYTINEIKKTPFSFLPIGRAYIINMVKSK